jgi:hypothetical protein
LGIIAKIAVWKQAGWWPEHRQCWNNKRTRALITSQATYRMAVGTSSTPGAVLPAPSINFWTSSRVISGKSMLRAATDGVALGMSPASTTFVSNSLTSKSLFSSMLLTRGRSGCCGSVRGGLL